MDFRGGGPPELIGVECNAEILEYTIFTCRIRAGNGMVDNQGLFKVVYLTWTGIWVNFAINMF